MISCRRLFLWDTACLSVVMTVVVVLPGLWRSCCQLRFFFFYLFITLEFISFVDTFLCVCICVFLFPIMMMSIVVCCIINCAIWFFFSFTVQSSVPVLHHFIIHIWYVVLFCKFSFPPFFLFFQTSHSDPWNHQRSERGFPSGHGEAGVPLRWKPVKCASSLLHQRENHHHPVAPLRPGLRLSGLLYDFAVSATAEMTFNP